MPRQGTLIVIGYTEMMRACNLASRESKQFTRSVMRDVGDLVKVDATRLFSPVDSRSASGYRTRVRVKNVAVEQSLRKTTGKRGRYGALQMKKALLPALTANETNLQHKMEHALDLIERHFETGP